MASVSLLLLLLLQAMEKYLMTKLHERTFRQAPDDVERDELLAVRCAGLGFVQPAHLEVPEGVVDEGSLARAAAELNKMNNFKVGFYQRPDHMNGWSAGAFSDGRLGACCVCPVVVECVGMMVLATMVPAPAAGEPAHVPCLLCLFMKSQQEVTLCCCPACLCCALLLLSGPP
jgi:hypothetical protein